MLQTQALPYHFPSAKTLPGLSGESTAIKSNFELSQLAIPMQGPGLAEP